MKKIVFILLTLTGILNAQPICFNYNSTYSVGTNPERISTGDFNNDGLIDLAVTNHGSNSVSVLIGLGNGNFSAATNFSVGNGPVGIVNADFNNDGKLDLAVSNQSSNNVSILIGLGNGTFNSAVNYTVGTSPYDISTADFNNDNRPDLVTANYGNNKVTVLLCSITGTFSTSGNFNVGNSPVSVKSADFNGDGKKDLVVSHFISTFISVLLGNGTGGFSVASTYAVGFNNATSIVCKDMDADNITDILVSTTGRIGFFKGTGSGTFLSIINSLATNQPYDMEVRDFNGNGTDDLVTSAGSVTFDTYTISPTVSFTSMGSYTVTIPGDDYYSVESADFNSDGKYDLVLTNYSLGQVTIFLNGLPPVSAIPSSSIVCIGTSAIINASGANTYSWSTGATSASISVTPTVTTTYTLTGNGLNGCSNTTTNTIIVDSPTITANSGTICSGSNFTIIPSGASTYTTSGGTNVVSPIANTSYTVIGESINGCTNTAISNVIVNALPVINASTNNTLICTGQTASLTASGATSYTWNTSATSNVIAITPTTTTVYTVTGMDANGCSNSASFTQSVSLCTNIQNATLNNTIFNIFPNPNNGSFIIELDSNTIISIYNLLGEIIYSENLLEGKYSIDIQNQPNGVYIVKSNNNNHSFKLIKN